MTENLLIGCTAMGICLSLQCIVASLLLRALFRLERGGFVQHTLFGATWLLIGFMLVMMLGNFIQITLWAMLFVFYGEFTDLATAFYHSVVNFSTLGYGDVVMSEQHRLLGALEAANGVLMFGLTTGFLYALLNALMHRAWAEQLDLSRRSGKRNEGPNHAQRARKI
jgi:hypothetical protein